ncbi:MAG TPA: lysine--tRNA ligase [Patescibacteria group bacterium]|nr:lysine--tRNA ligase [Patescibacteria group bacterium]
MNWLSKIVDEVTARHPEGEIVVSSGVSPSGTYHLGTLREVLTAEVIARELKIRGRASRHIHVVDDLDVFRKIPVGVNSEYEKYLGLPLCDVPAPDGSNHSYADYYLADLLKAAKSLNLDMEVMRAHEKYRQGFFVPAIEKALQNVTSIRKILKDISGRDLGDEWSPVQVMEEGYLKNRPFVSIDTNKKELTYLDKDGHKQTTNYQKGEVKLNWRIDWPARWWLLNVAVEPFGRDHATKGGSYDTGEIIVKEIFDTDPPLPVPYHFINRSGETKKMSKSSGDTITAAELLEVLPAEVVWFFILRFPPQKQLFFEEGPTLMKLVDDFSELLSRPNKSPEEEKLIELCRYKIDTKTVSNIPFSHLVASYQASLHDPEKTLEVIKRTEHGLAAEADAEVIKNELKFIDAWLEKHAPEDVKFSLLETVDAAKFNDSEKHFLSLLADKVEKAPKDADGEWFHKAIYDLGEEIQLKPKELFATLYQALIGKDSGPRAGWFLSILPKDWLINRFRLKSHP